MSGPVIVLDRLTKCYGKHRGIEDISFAVNEGEIFGFIGPDGAGKSTNHDPNFDGPAEAHRRQCLPIWAGLWSTRGRDGLSAQ